MAETQDLSDVQTAQNGGAPAGSRLERATLDDLRALGGLLLRTGAGGSLDARLLLELVAGYEAAREARDKPPVPSVPPDLGSLRERLQSHQTRLVRMRSSMQSDRDLLEDLDETLAWLRRCTGIEPPPGPCPSQQRLLVVGTPVFCGLRAGHAGMHEEAPRHDRPAVAWTGTGPELDWACMATGCKRRGLNEAGCPEHPKAGMLPSGLPPMRRDDQVALEPPTRGPTPEDSDRSAWLGGRPGLRHAWPETWKVDRLAARGENPGDALELVAEGINERLLAVMDRMPDGRMRTALSECRGFLQAMFVAAEGVKAQGARLEAALAQRADERGSTRWPDVPAHSKALIVEAAAHKVTLGALEAIAEAALEGLEDARSAGDALQSIGDRAQRALERGRMARDPDRGDGGTDLQQAMEIYYASGGLPSAIERTESAWFWRRTAKIATERAGTLGRRLDKLENALHFLRRVAAEEADAQRAMTPGMDSNDYAERELSSHRDTLRRLAEHASYASYGNGVRATAVLFQASGAAAASAWLQGKLGVAAEASWLAQNGPVAT